MLLFMQYMYDYYDSDVFDNAFDRMHAKPVL